MYNRIWSHRLTTLSPINPAGVHSRLRPPSTGSSYGLGGLSRRDRQRQSIDSCLPVLLPQRSPKTVGRPTSATRGDAQTRRGRQQAERCHRMGISGRTCGDAGLQKVLFLLWRVEARSDTGVAARQGVGLPPPDGFPKAFSFSPVFLFHARKRKMGCGRLTGANGPRGHTPHTNAIPDRVILPCRAIGEPPARVPRRKTSHRDVLRPSCAFLGEGFRVPRDAAERQIAMPPSTRITSPVI